MLNSYYIVSELNSKTKINLVKKSKINVIFRPITKDYNNEILKQVIKTNIHNKVYLANNNNICKIKGLAGIYLSAFNKKTLVSNYFRGKTIIGSAHSIKEICQKIRSQCNIIFLSPILKKEHSNIKPLGLIKFLLISKLFNRITFVPLGGIYHPNKLKSYGIKEFAGVKFFEKNL